MPIKVRDCVLENAELSYLWWNAWNRNIFSIHNTILALYSSNFMAVFSLHFFICTAVFRELPTVYANKQIQMHSPVHILEQPDCVKFLPLWGDSVQNCPHTLEELFHTMARLQNACSGKRKHLTKTPLGGLHFWVGYATPSLGLEVKGFFPGIHAYILVCSLLYSPLPLIPHRRESLLMFTKSLSM